MRRAVKTAAAMAPIAAIQRFLPLVSWLMAHWMPGPSLISLAVGVAVFPALSAAASGAVVAEP